ncbi:MAG TPA: hypothetical protein PKM44_12175, partial [Turneriella sp.]|nr:hypothetical protein [Turneriella sp.]
MCISLLRAAAGREIRMQKHHSKLSIFGLLFALGCSGTSTSQLLEIAFIKADTYLSIETESLVSSGKTFVVTVTARKRNINTLDLGFTNQLSVTSSGAGTLNVGTIEPWSQGKTRITLSYTTTVGVGSLDTIILQLAAAGTSITA